MSLCQKKNLGRLLHNTLHFAIQDKTKPQNRLPDKLIRQLEELSDVIDMLF